MKFTAVLALVAAATAVSASTNAERFARGLPPNAPAKRATPAQAARRGSPSGTSQCNTGPVKCCNSSGNVGSNGEIDELLALLGLNLPIGTEVFANCSPITGAGIGNGGQCTSQTVCCENDQFNGLINIGCSPININL